MAWLEQIQRNMEYLDSEPSMPIDEHYHRRYLNGAERKFLRGKVVPHTGFGLAMQRSIKAEARWNGQTAYNGDEDSKQDTKDFAQYIERLDQRIVKTYAEADIKLANIFPKGRSTLRQGRLEGYVKMKVDGKAAMEVEEPKEPPKEDRYDDSNGTIGMKEPITQ